MPAPSIADTPRALPAAADAFAPAQARPAPLGITRIAPDGWDRTVAEFDGICQEQLVAFAAVRWPGTTPEPLLFEADGEVVGGALVLLQKLPLGLATIAVVKWAPMLKDASRPDAMAVYAGMVEALVAEYGDRRGMMLSVLPHAAFGPQNLQYEHLEQRGFRKGSQLLFPNRYVVNLRLSDDEQRASFQQTWRRQLNKAMKAGLELEHADAGRLPEFNRLYEAMTDRKKFPDHSAYETVQGLMDIADDRLRPELFFVREGGEIVAGAIIFKAGERAVYLYGATNDRALPLRAGYFLHWHIIGWLRDNTSARWYDLGGTDGFQGLHQFKKGMVGEAGVIAPVPPVANYATNRLAYLLGAGAFAARDGLNHLKRRIDAMRADRAKPDQSKPDHGRSADDSAA